MPQLQQGFASLFALQARAGDEILMNTDGAVDFAPAAIEISQRQMGLDGLAVDLQYLDEGLDCLVGLLVEQVVDALK